MVTALVGSCKLVRHTQIQVLACSVQLLGWWVVKGIDCLCQFMASVKWGFRLPLCLVSGCWFWAVVLVLVMAWDVFDVDVPGASDGIRIHEAPH